MAAQRLLSLVVCFAFALPVPGAPPESVSAVVEPYYFALKSLPTARVSIAEYASYQERIWRSLGEVAERVYAAYTTSRWSKAQAATLEHALSDPSDRERLNSRLHEAFLAHSLEQLERAASARLRELARRVKETPLLLFRLVAQPRLGPGDKKAGFHRGKRSLFLDYAQVPPEEWLVIFIHESAHALDDRLLEGVTEYARAEQVERFVEWSRSTSHFADLSDDRRAQLEHWLLAGLSRGFLGEWRAWWLTLELYEDGLSEGLWTKIDWLEEVRARCEPKSRRAAFLMRYLSPRFEDPSDGVFSNPLLRDALRSVRTRLVTGELRPPLGSLERILYVLPDAVFAKKSKP